ncbi:MAG: ABC transporter ATP-binding protein [Mariprofundaceae bacterium]|nr:ABC transporter ATP-binding protein [Mariprofundaceae bacterium]
MKAARKIWYLLTRDQRRAAVVLLGLMLVGMLLEMLGIGLIIPALTIITQEDPAANYPALAPWLNRLGNPGHEQLVMIGMLVLVGVYAVKAVFLAFLAWRQMRFVYGVQADLSQRLFVGYLNQPYTFHLQRNSAQLIRNIMIESYQFTHTALMAGATLLAEILVLLGILALLIAVEPLGTLLVITTFGLAGYCFYRFTGHYVSRWGEARQVHEGLRIQHLQEGLGGAKDVKLLGREGDFFAQYQLHNRGSARVGQRQATLQQLPRLLLEFLAVSGLAVLVLVMIEQDKPLASLLPTLGLFAAAAFRLMPSAARVLGTVQNVRFALPVIDTLCNELQLLDTTIRTPQPAEPILLNKALTLEEISFCYPSAGIRALSGVSLSVSKGTSVGFIGGSGAGKSTLVDIILGLLTPDSGSVKIDGIDIQENLRSWQDQIGYVPQVIFLTDDTLRCNVAFGLPDDQIDEEAVIRAVQAAQLEQFVNDLPQGLDTNVGERGVRLSGGQRQRIGIARALYHDPQVLVLDEATSSLDTATEQSVMQAVQALQGDKTILIVAHRLSTVEQCDHIFRLDRGCIVEEGKAGTVLGTTAERTASPKNFKSQPG